jgi:hypothetical protein
MTTKLVIAIERGTDAKACGPCRYMGKRSPAEVLWCSLFQSYLIQDNVRLPKCLAAEHEAGKLGEIRNVNEAP